MFVDNFKEERSNVRYHLLLSSGSNKLKWSFCLLYNKGLRCSSTFVSFALPRVVGSIPTRAFFLLNISFRNICYDKLCAGAVVSHLLFNLMAWDQFPKSYVLHYVFSPQKIKRFGSTTDETRSIRLHQRKYLSLM